MKRLKALIKMELPAAALIGIYFMIINFISFAMIQSQITHTWEQYLCRGIADFIQYSIGFEDVFTGEISANLHFVTLMYGIGFVFLVFFSFLKDKNHETGRFLKALPYTAQERAAVKVGVGLCSFLAGFAVYSMGLFALRAKIMSVFGEIYEVSRISNVWESILSKIFITKLLVIFFLLCVGVYLFLVMMQYIISPNLGSVISSVFIFFAPLFILMSSLLYPNIVDGVWINSLGSFLINMLAGPREVQYFTTVGDGSDITNYNSIGSIVSYVSFWGVIILITAVGIWKLSKASSIEKTDVFISNKVFRWIYIIGATVCGAVLVGDMYNSFIYSANGAVSVLVLIVGGIVSFVIANAVGHLGVHKKNKEVKA